MRIPKKRLTVAAVLALAFAALPAAASISPAHAGTHCEYFAGPTPAVEADIDGDGNPDVRVPSLRDVSVCAEADVFVHGTPLTVENCHPWGALGCWKILIHAQAGATVDTGLFVCRTVDGVRTCSTIDQREWSVYTPDVNRICIGIDLEGTSPCSSGALIGFE